MSAFSQYVSTQISVEVCICTCSYFIKLLIIQIVKDIVVLSECSDITCCSFSGEIMLASCWPVCDCVIQTVAIRWDSEGVKPPFVEEFINFGRKLGNLTTSSSEFLAKFGGCWRPIGNRYILHLSFGNVLPQNL
jgi:hypothetical protein